MYRLLYNHLHTSFPILIKNSPIKIYLKPHINQNLQITVQIQFFINNKTSKYSTLININKT